jgi:hypothetical protein
MSLLNLPGDGTRSVLVVIYRLLLQEGPLLRSKLLDLCAPKDIVDPKSTSITLNTWIDLGLFEEKNGKVSISPNVSKKERDERFLSQNARARVFAAENNEKFWEVDKSKSADFNRAISWLFAQDAYQAELKSWEGEVIHLIKAQVNEDDALLGRNDTRWNGLKHWLPYLGLAWILKNGTVIVDPAIAIREVLSLVFGNKQTLPVDVFMASLSERIPIIDGGVYRKQVEGRLLEVAGPSAWTSQPQGQLSTSLSRGLLRLISAGVLSTENRSDADGRVVLTGRNSETLGTFSHYTYNSNQ